MPDNFAIANTANPSTPNPAGSIPGTGSGIPTPAQSGVFVQIPNESVQSTVTLPTVSVHAPGEIEAAARRQAEAAELAAARQKEAEEQAARQREAAAMEQASLEPGPVQEESISEPDPMHEQIVELLKNGSIPETIDADPGSANPELVAQATPVAPAPVVVAPIPVITPAAPAPASVQITPPQILPNPALVNSNISTSVSVAPASNSTIPIFAQPIATAPGTSTPTIQTTQTNSSMTNESNNIAQQPAPASATPASSVTTSAAAPAKVEQPGFFARLFGSKPKPVATPAPAQPAPASASVEATKPAEPAQAQVAPAANPPAASSKAEAEKAVREAEKLYQQGVASIRDLIAPSSLEIHYNYLNLGGRLTRSFFVYTYPRYIETNWLSPVVNFAASFDMSQFIYPVKSDEIMRLLRRKVAQIGSSIHINQEKGNVRDPALETAYEDAEQLRTDLQRGSERFFHFALYFTVYADDEKSLESATKQLESLLGGKMVLTKRADIRGEHAFNSTVPMCVDELEVTRNMNTGPLSTTFPFLSFDLTSDSGILYGLNRHNDSLIIFDRFKLPNANSVVFASSGAGKSYAVKLEILRYLMMKTDVIVIDPENEYEDLAQTVGGTFIRVSLNSEQRINPFDLPQAFAGQEEHPGDLLRSNIMTLTGLMKLMLGQMSATEESLLDKALIDTYAVRGITMETEDPGSVTPPTMEDFYSVISSMRGAENLAERLTKYTSGTFGGLFNKPTNVDLGSGLVVFCIRDLEDELRPIATYIVLNYIWNKVRSSLKRRMLVVDEAWSLMQHEDAAKFLYGLVKRARKYYLGVTTITQDVEDFMHSPYGKPIVTNSSMQLLLKQAPSAADALVKTFNLTEGEKYLLLNSGVGQGLFFAGQQHVAIQIIASYGENEIVTTNPEEKLRQQAAKEF